MDLKGSKTEKNLYRTFLGESRARNKYTLYAEKAKKEGYQWIASIFDVTSGNELAHARKVYNDYLNLICNTKENLVDSIYSETSEFKDAYLKFEEEARQEGFKEIADFFKELREVEEEHAKRFKELYDKLDKETIFKGTKDSKWVCMNCGYIYEGAEAPQKCPLCGYPKSYFKPYCKIEN